MKNLKINEVIEFSANNSIQLIDTRSPDFFENNFIKGSINLSLNLSKDALIKNLIGLEKKIIIICEENYQEDSIQHLNQFGFKNYEGIYVFNPEIRNTSLFEMIISISSEELVLDSIHNSKAIIIDVRNEEDYNSGKIYNAIHIPINKIANESNKLLKNQETLIYSNKGITSMLVCSFLKAGGFTNVKNVWGGFEQLKKEPKAIID